MQVTTQVDDITRAQLATASSKLQIARGACFAAGTPILTTDGATPIERLRAGDEVLTRSEFDASGPVRARRVEAVFRLQADVVELRLGSQTITTTMEHPLYREGEGWVRVMDLQPGDRLVGRDGQATRLDTITRTETRATVYNLRVATDHTYFVGDADWGFSLWVHNAYLVQSVADGTFQIVDDVGNVIRKGIPDQATASALAIQLNTPAVQQLGAIDASNASPDAAAVQNAIEELPNTGKIAAPRSATVGKYSLTETVANHLDDFVTKGALVGQKARPFLNSPHLLDEIMAAGKGVPDKFVDGALRWDVPGTFRGRSGVWELVVDTKTNTVLHWNFVGGN